MAASRRHSTRKRAHIELAELANPHRSCLVARIHVSVARRKFVSIKDALLDQKVAPQHIAVTREQRVVQVEECEFLARHLVVIYGSARM